MHLLNFLFESSNVLSKLLLWLFATHGCRLYDGLQLCDVVQMALFLFFL